MMKQAAKKAHPLLNESSPFAIREAFNHLRVNLNYATDTSGCCPVYAITSAAEKVGKSTIISNLAISYAQTGKHVLLIDGDMRLPAQAISFDLPKASTGLSEILSGILSDPMQAIQKTAHENLDIVTSGRIPPNPAELFEGSAFEAMLNKFKANYDVILIDFPPIDAVADALSISKHVTGYLLAVRAGRSDSKAVRQVVEAMKSVDAKILGVVFNEINPKAGNHHYNYYSSYEKNAK